MFDPAMMTLAINVAALTTVYWVCLIVGGGLLAISTVLGSNTDADLDVADAADALDGADAGADFDADVGGDVAHGGAAALSAWFSIRFLVFAVAVFGALGVILTHLSQTKAELVLVIALAGGVAVGQFVHQLMRMVRRTSGDSTPQPRDYVDKLARVTIAINPPKKGQVALTVGHTRRYVAAIAQRPQVNFNVGDEVVVVAYRAGIAEVVSRAEHEALTV
jgi:hypothetical protein